jgi:hypothetical protein
MSRIERILELSTSQEFLEMSGLVAAYCNCLTPEEACDLLLKSPEAHGPLRNSVLRKISKDIHQSFSMVHRQLLQLLLAKFAVADARGRQRLGYCLSTLAENLPAKERQTIQSIFLRSKYVGVRKRGYKSLLQEEEVPHDLVHEAWSQYRDPACAWLIVKTAPIAYLVEHHDSLADSLSEGWQLSRLYLRIAEVDLSLLDELRSRDPISYCYVLAKLGIKLSTMDAEGFIASSAGDKRFGLLVWSFGQLGLWEVLEHIQAQLPAIREQRFSRLREQFGIGSIQSGSQ